MTDATLVGQQHPQPAGPTEARAVDGPLVDRLKRSLSRDDPVPLYHQIAMMLRWEIGAGRAAVGEPLPPIRSLAEALSVNYQTVRQAYRSLAEEGVAEPRRGLGTVVRRVPALGQRAGPAVGAGAGAGIGIGRPVVVVECNMTQATDLARQVEAACGIPAIPWLLDGHGEPPDGVILGTTFHDLGMRQRWSHRTGALHALRLELDPSAPAMIRRAAGVAGTSRIVVVERDRGTGSGLAADLSAGLDGEPVEVWHGTVADSAALLGDEAILVVYAPRVWDGLGWADRTHPRALTVPMYFPEESLAELATHYGWFVDEG